MPELPGLPDIPDLEEILPPLDELLYGPARKCPVCKWYEDHVCRPLMTKGDLEVCGEKLTEVRALLGKIPEDEHMKLSLEALEEFGIDPNAPRR